MHTVSVAGGGNKMLEDKVRDVFADMVVLKNPERTEFFSNLSLPSYMRDWLVMKFSDDNGMIDYDSVLIPADEFIKYCLEPAKEMRSIIKKQLCIIDPKEFNVPGKKDIPDIQYNY